MAINITTETPTRQQLGLFTQLEVCHRLGILNHRLIYAQTRGLIPLPSKTLNGKTRLYYSFDEFELIRRYFESK